jgi:hypothetical protein
MAVQTHGESAHIEGPRRTGPSWQPSIRSIGPVQQILNRRAASSTPILYESVSDHFGHEGQAPRFGSPRVILC